MARERAPIETALATAASARRLGDRIDSDLGVASATVRLEIPIAEPRH